MANVPTIIERAKKEFLAPIADQLRTALPATVDPTRFQAAFITAIQNNPELVKCTPDSVRNALMKCAADGLVPDNRMAALVTFKNQAQYIPMVQGIISRAKELGDTLSITSVVVHDKDEFSYDPSDPTITTHKTPKLGTDRGDIIGAYVIFRDNDNRIIHREVMERQDIDKARGASRASNSPAWRDWLGEMARKTVIRRGSKYVPMSDALRQIVNREDEHFLDLKANETPTADYNPLVQDDGEIDLVAGYAHALEGRSKDQQLSDVAKAYWLEHDGWPPANPDVQDRASRVFALYTQLESGEIKKEDLTASLRALGV